MAASSPARKCTPSTMASSEITRSKPGRPGSTAASSSRPSAAGAPRVSGRSAAIQSNSSGGALIAGDGVEGGVDEPRFGAFEERLGDLDIFVDGDLGGHVGAPHQLEGAGAQDRAGGRVDPLQPPAARE